MAKFIKLTDPQGKKNITVNSDRIAYMRPRYNNGSGTIITMAGVREHQDWFYVVESIDDIMFLIKQ